MYLLLIVLLMLVALLLLVALWRYPPVQPQEVLAGTVFEVDIPRTPESQELGMYNLSVHRTENGYHGLVRASTWNGCRPDNIAPAYSSPYRLTLDENCQVTGLERIDLPYEEWTLCHGEHNVHANGIEDPKLFRYRDTEWVIGNLLGSPMQAHPCVNVMCIFQLDNPRETFRILQLPFGIPELQQQKNWSPFEHNGRLLCEYTLQPHEIVEIDVDTGEVRTLYTSGESDISIKLGHSLRGGAPPIRLEMNPTESKRDYYLGLGHTRVPGESSYLHFFYIFEADEPFIITRITRPFKFDLADKIQFAAGLSYRDGHVYVSYGVDDCHNRVTSYPLMDLLARMEDA